MKAREGGTEGEQKDGGRGDRERMEGGKEGGMEGGREAI